MILPRLSVPWMNSPLRILAVLVGVGVTARLATYVKHALQPVHKPRADDISKLSWCNLCCTKMARF